MLITVSSGVRIKITPLSPRNSPSDESTTAWICKRLVLKNAENKDKYLKAVKIYADENLKASVKIITSTRKTDAGGRAGISAEVL